MTLSNELGVVLKRTVGFNSTFQSVCSDRLLEKAASRRRSEHTDRNIELQPTVLFRTTPNSLEIVIAWCYRKPFYIVFPPCKVSNPTQKNISNEILVPNVEKVTDAFVDRRGVPTN